jgi:hypothetical protein
MVSNKLLHAILGMQTKFRISVGQKFIRLSRSVLDKTEKRRNLFRIRSRSHAHFLRSRATQNYDSIDSGNQSFETWTTLQFTSYKANGSDDRW